MTLQDRAEEHIRNIDSQLAQLRQQAAQLFELIWNWTHTHFK